MPETDAAGPCLVESGPGKGKACQFPFLWQFNEKVYDGCAFDQTMDVAPWCSTKVVGGVHQTGQGEWGYCGPGCPREAGSAVGVSAPCSDQRGKHPAPNHAPPYTAAGGGLRLR
jgi:hypothetical protein